MLTALKSGWITTSNRCCNCFHYPWQLRQIKQHTDMHLVCTSSFTFTMDSPERCRKGFCCIKDSFRDRICITGVPAGMSSQYKLKYLLLSLKHSIASLLCSLMPPAVKAAALAEKTITKLSLNPEPPPPSLQVAQTKQQFVTIPSFPRLSFIYSFVFHWKNKCCWPVNYVSAWMDCLFPHHKIILLVFPDAFLKA